MEGKWSEWSEEAGSPLAGKWEPHPVALRFRISLWWCLCIVLSLKVKSLMPGSHLHSTGWISVWPQASCLILCSMSENRHYLERYNEIKWDRAAAVFRSVPTYHVIDTPGAHVPSSGFTKECVGDWLLVTLWAWLFFSFSSLPSILFPHTNLVRLTHFTFTWEQKA